MSTPYIPNDDLGKLAWLANMATWLGPNGVSHGFTLGEITAFSTAYGQFGSDAAANDAAQAAARAATQAKNDSRDASIALARDYVARIQAHPSTTDAERASLQITVRDTTPTHLAADFLATIPAPILLLDFSQRGQVTVHWGPNPSDENHNARPANTIGCQIFYAVGGIPTDPAQWILVEIDNESPVTFYAPDSVPTTYAFRARYVGKNLKFGVFGDPVVCTVSV